MSVREVVIVSAQRTPIGAFQGVFNDVKTTALGSAAIQGALNAIKLSADTIDEVYMGCVLPAGLGQAPARQAALQAGITKNTPCATINKVCGSGMKAIMLGVDQIRIGQTKTIVAGGMESMTNAPYLLSKARGGYRLGHGKIFDHMFLDGLEDAYTEGGVMGLFAEATADKYGFTREEQDAFAKESSLRAIKAIQSGVFNGEISSVTISSRKGDIVISEDETPSKVNPDKIPQLKPAFKKDGTVTAANSSSISDGAAAVVLMEKEHAEKSGHKILATVKGHATFAQEPEWFTTAPVGAIQKLCEQIGWSIEDVDFFEINEAFAVVTMATMKDLKIPHEKVNIYGGACALGHPIGASGARLVVTLIHALHTEGKKKGIASLCIGGGEAVALAVEI
ncbi:thiolase family protein [Candidatus Odyssella acanthamoebae]|uniref:Acetyl-CoA acetyltransferase n=1 Tax=Candidatus Odyssella acanthamoebae TaxID=91604 RepID=A0A077AWP3_9PROT|nr:acetyl-CoA C-acyltransferase [Candidatus Paracaedibacter acanthamoebae]AIK96058.1 acetyl-CoA acetyltransferase [Candidatus Paracaedibacter acanthamoebae]